MTPKEKAEELINKFTWHPMTKESMVRTKQNALCCVSCIIQENIDNMVSLDTSECEGLNNHEFWRQTQMEIEKLA